MTFSPDAFARLKTLDRLVPDARAAFARLISYAKAQGYQPYIVSAVRTCAEESGLSATKVRRSWHVLGRAVDVELHAKGQAASIEDAYAELGAWWKAEGGTWGGDWTDLYPLPHPAGWCGPTTVPGDTCHFQWTAGVESVPASVWPREVTACPDVDQLQAAYFRSQGAAPPVQDVLPAGGFPGVPPPSPNTPTGAVPARGGAVVVAAGFLGLLVLLRRRSA